MHLRKVPKTKKLVILGDGLFAQIAYECFTHDSEYEVKGFAVDKEFLKREALFGLPVSDTESLADRFSPDSHSIYAAIVYTGLNRVRTRLMMMSEGLGYTLASYVSSHAFVWPNAKLGKHCFIFENNVIQPFVEIGDNVVLWSGNHIGHHSRIRNNVFISSHVVISGSCDIGNNCFLGVNSTLANNITLGDDCFLNLSTTATKSLEGDKMYRGTPAMPYKGSARGFFKVGHDDAQ